MLLLNCIYIYVYIFPSTCVAVLQVLFIPTFGLFEPYFLYVSISPIIVDQGRLLHIGARGQFDAVMISNQEFAHLGSIPHLFLIPLTASGCPNMICDKSVDVRLSVSTIKCKNMDVLICNCKIKFQYNSVNSTAVTTMSLDTLKESVKVLFEIEERWTKGGQLQLVWRALLVWVPIKRTNCHSYQIKCTVLHQLSAEVRSAGQITKGEEPHCDEMLPKF